MRSILGSLCALIAVVVTLGCQPVREDRTIHFAGDGKNVSFQHGQQGVFVADDNGGGLTKIFKPAEDTLAVSTPLWSPTDKRLIFTTASVVPGEPEEPTTINFSDPAGAVHGQRQVLYTCWLRGEDGAAPKALFSAHCDHVGYVAANLAVRWHPKGDRLLYVDAMTGHEHRVYELDLKTRANRRVFPHAGAALIFDWAPDNEHLVCVLAQAQRDPKVDGIWIGKPGQDDWWHVPESRNLAQGEMASLIEQLKATRPAWTPDGRRFAFVSSKPGPKHHLHTVNFAAKTVTAAAESDQPFHHLRWAPDGQRLGIVQGQDGGRLRILADDNLGEPLTANMVRQFAGWHKSGSHLAYVVPEVPKELSDNSWWAFLLAPDLTARDTVWLTDGAVKDAGKPVLSGMRITFPQWSPTENKLSLWATFAPQYRSWLGHILGSGLRHGDPAAVVDLNTGEYHWMAVNAHEKAQVGHYYLLKHDYAQAWRWYEDAARSANKQSPLPDDVAFFEYLCLTKLNRDAEARVKLDQFRQTFVPPVSLNGPVPLATLNLDGKPAEVWVKELLQPDSVTGALLRDLYEAEIFLAVDAAADGEAYFRARLAEAATPTLRFSRAVVLAQFLLLQQKHHDYAALTSGTVLPLLLELGRPEMFQTGNLFSLQGVRQLAVLGSGGLSLLPLANPRFLDAVTADELRLCVPLLQSLRARLADSFSQHQGDCVLLAVYRKLGMQKERQEILTRLQGGEAQCDREIRDWPKMFLGLGALARPR